MAAADRGGREQPVRSALSAEQGFLAPLPRPPSLGSRLGGRDFFLEVCPPPHGAGFEPGLQSGRRLQDPRGTPTPHRSAHASPEPRKAQPQGASCTPGGGSGGESPLLPPWHPSPGLGQGPRQVGAQARGARRGAGRTPGGGGGEPERGGGGRSLARLSRDPVRRWSGLRSPPPPPEAAGWTVPSPLPGSREGSVRRAGWDGGEAAPHLPGARAGKLRRRWEGQPPRPHPGEPIGKLTRCVTPISMLSGEQAAGSRSAPSAPAAPRAPGAALARMGPAPPSWGRRESRGDGPPRVPTSPK